MVKNKYLRLNELASKYIRDYAYLRGNDIYKFMDKYKIGANEFGKIMDAKGKCEAVHRLYGHNIIYDFPIEYPEKIGEFLEHLFSDLFTKQGLPILPGEMLEYTGLIKYCKNLNGYKNWNLVNGFDILTATISIYSGLISLDTMLNTNYSINTFEDFAKNFGIGAIELAVAMSTCNPFLLIGAILELTSGIIGVFNEGSRVYVQLSNNRLMLKIKINNSSLKNSTSKYILKNKTIFIKRK